MDLEPKAVEYTAKLLSINVKNTLKVLELLIIEECTVPFVSRYRKEATGGLDEVQIGNIQEAYAGYLERESRRTYILETIRKQEKLTKELEAKILAAKTTHQLEDLYAPYKNKKKTKGAIAIEVGLAPLAEIIKTTQLSLSEIEKKHGNSYINTEKKIENFEAALEGAKSIIIEEIAHHVDIKDGLRQDYWRSATLKSIKRKDAEKVKDFHKFKDYFEFEQKVSELKNAKASHRFLAMRRGMLLKILKVEVNFDEQIAIKMITAQLFNLNNLGCAEIISECIAKGYKNYIHSSLDLEIKSELKLCSDESAIDVFGINLKNLLLLPYLGQKAVIGIDPGIRTGCKVAVIDKNGKFLVDTVIYPHPPKNDFAGTQKIIEAFIQQWKIQYIAIGNGTYGKETLQFLQKNIVQIKNGKVKAMLVNEDGASIYSASEIARQEFPDKDLTVRGAISIARRFQDPLAELVKIDPKSIGVGQYQHDVNQAKLKKSLTSVVENCVNYVGVDLNTASAPLLSYISGIGPAVATNIVKARDKLGGFKDRQELLKVGRFTPKVFEQSAGFLRIYDGKNPLDETFIHPERYEIIESWCQKQKLSLKDLLQDSQKISQLQNDNQLKNTLGEFTHKDIVKTLSVPGQDPRTEFVPFAYREDLSDIKDLKTGQWYPGIVTNITQFGAFVDVGIKENGLIHVSQMADRFVDNALDFLKVGQEVKAKVLEVDLERKRISLSLKSASKDKGASTGRVKNKQKVKKNNPPKEINNGPFAALKKWK